MRYAPLHNHTVFSIKDAIAQPIDYVKRIHEYNDSQTEHEIVALAVTEHGNMYSTVLHHEACVTPIKGGNGKTIKPIYGNEVYHIEDLANIDMADARERYHLVLLAKNETGLQNLFEITTHAGLNKCKPGKSRKDFQITDEKFIENHGEGIIALSACMGGKVGRLIVEGKYQEAKEFALKMANVFDEFYLEIQPHDTLPEQMLINNALLEMHKETGLPLVITTDSHYVYKEDKKYHDLMKQIDFLKPFTVDAHLWTPDELIAWCNKYGIPLEAIENTAKIADKCTADITPKDSKGLMPSYPCPKGYSEDAYLIKMANEGLKKRFTTNKDIVDINKYVSRLNYELDVITQMGFSSYFLILWDWFAYCKANKITLGPGRGSGAGSLVAYVLDITKIDPIKNGLIFERFLNPERIEEPDVDTDISKLDRSRSIEYLKQKYGDDHVCQIMTFGKYKLKNTIKAVLSAERGFTAEYQNSITKMIPDTLGEEGVTYELVEDIVNNPDNYADSLSDREISTATNIYNTLQEVFADYPEVKDAITHLRGAISSTGIHAGGVVISSKVIRQHIPLMKGSDTAVLPVCQTNMDGIHFFHGLKIDALGLKTLSEIRLCMDLAGIPEEWLDDEDTSDEEIYKFLRAGNTANVFQMHKFTPTAMIKDFNVNNLEGLTAVNAGNRPGPLAKGEDGKSMVDRYVDIVKSGDIPSIDPRIDYILAPTNGQLWFQEQLQEIGRVMAGYSLGAADLRIRKVIAKKLRDKIPEIRNEFVYGKKSLYDADGKVCGISEEDSPYCIGAVRNGFDEALALKMFADMEAFASYCFNKSHSAAYGFLAYRTAWLSYYYPVEWAVACLTLDAIDNNAKDKIIATLNACKKREIKILPPDINQSSTGFTVGTFDNKKCVRYGFLAIKGVGSNIADMISKLIAEDGEFTSFQNFLDRTINAKTNDTLRRLCAEDPSLHSIKEDKDGNPVVKINNPFKKTNIVPLILSGAFDSLEPNRHKLFNEYVKFKKEKKEELKDEAGYKLKDQLAYELELLGYYVSQHPLDGSVFPYVDLDTVRDGQGVRIAGIFRGYETAKTKKGDKYYKIKMELKDGKVINMNVFKNTYTKHPECIQGLNSKRAKEGREIFIVSGKYSTQWNNLNVDNITKVRSRDEEEDDTIPELTDGIPELGLPPVKDSPLDEDLFTKGA